MDVGRAVHSIVVAPSRVLLSVGDTLTVSASVLDVEGVAIPEKVPFWKIDNPVVATIDSASGLLTALSADTTTARVRAESIEVAVPVQVVSGATGSSSNPADPTLLPVANGQDRDDAAYRGASLAAGQTYADPATGVRVLKLTDGNTPFPNNARGVPDYSEGGPHISQPWDSAGSTYYTVYLLVGASPSTHYFADVRHADLALVNWRQLPAMTNTDLRWAWSLDPGTPRVGYGLGMPYNNVLRKFDTGAMEELTGGGFPKTLPEGVAWLQNSVNDAWFVSSSTTTVYAYSPLTDVLHAWSIPGMDEPHFDRSGAYVYVLVRGGSEAPNCAYRDNPVMRIFRTADGSEFQPAPNVGAWPDGCRNELWNSHPAGLTGRVAASNPHASYNTPGRYEYAYDPATDVATFHHTDTETFKSSHHRAGQWVFDNAPRESQWYLVSQFGTPSGETQGLHDAIAFISIDSSQPVRLLAHHYSVVGSDYFTQPHASPSPDGKLVLWGSNMGVSGGRIDAFVARTPTQ